MLAPHRSLQANIGWYLVLLLLAGCATATVTPSWQATKPLPRPEQVLVYDFTVLPGDTRLDSGLGPKLNRLINRTDQSKEAMYLGKAFARILATNLAVELRMRGIKAYHGRDDTLPGDNTISIMGRFLRIDEGNSTLRTVIGFGLGGTEMQSYVRLLRATEGQTQLLAEAYTMANSNLKPGMPPMIAAGGAAGALVEVAAVAGITTISNERFFATAEADAKRTAVELADWVAHYYRQQGWLGP